MAYSPDLAGLLSSSREGHSLACFTKLLAFLSPNRPAIASLRDAASQARVVARTVERRLLG